MVAGMRNRPIATATAITAAGFSLLSPATGVGRCVGASTNRPPRTARRTSGSPHIVFGAAATIGLGWLGCCSFRAFPASLPFSLSQRNGGSLPTRVRAGLHPAMPRVSVMVASSDTAMADGLPDEIFRSSTVSLPVEETKVGKINLNRNVPVLAS
jgi:hypothetical protein